MQNRPGSEVDEFIDALPQAQREVVAGIRRLVLENLPDGYAERVSGECINYEVPLARYPKTYNGQPLMYAAIAAHKTRFTLYLMSAYQDPAIEERLRAGFAAAGKKLDMGKSCLRFKTLEDLPLDLVGSMIAHSSVSDFIAQYEAARSGRQGRQEV